MIRKCLRSHGAQARARCIAALALAALLPLLAPGAALAQEAAPPANPAPPAPPPPIILAVSAADSTGYPIDAAGKRIIDAADADTTAVPEIRLNDRLVLFLDRVGAAGIDPSKAVLALNGRPITGLKDTVYLAKLHALVFHLARTGDNAGDWGSLLGSPTLQARRIEVGFWTDPNALKKPTPPAAIAREDGTPPQFDLRLISAGWLLVAIVAGAVVVVAIIAGARNTNLLRDSLLPQLPQKEQPFSLGRVQMAFWFTLIFTAYIFLFVLLQDYNTLTNQSLILMGLSGATAIFSVAIDATKNSPVGIVDEKLRAIGLSTCADVLKLQQDIADNARHLRNATDPDEVLKLQTIMAELTAKQRVYLDETPPFKTVGWYRDLTTDINGPALHRVQVFYWTLALGIVFLVEVYQSLAMPQFSETLLTVMGITSAGYLGFKYPEKQN